MRNKEFNLCSQKCSNAFNKLDQIQSTVLSDSITIGQDGPLLAPSRKLLIKFLNYCSTLTDTTILSFTQHAPK